ncbi:MAG: hypothetical protein KIT79_13245 [Deltaproteobacteria bacterium]|nr:hypothetical protein [Deltaproteobacteria bacterium]
MGAARVWCAGAALVLLAASISPAAMYKYTDETGTVHFVDSEEKIPPRYRKKAATHSPTVRVPSLQIGDEIQSPRKSESPPVPPENPQVQPPRSMRIELDVGPAGPAARGPVMSGREFWQRRKKMLQEKIGNLENGCSYWTRLNAETTDNARKAAAAAEADRQCGELTRARADLDLLPREIRDQGGDPAWLR